MSRGTSTIKTGIDFKVNPKGIQQARAAAKALGKIKSSMQEISVASNAMAKSATKINKALKHRDKQYKKSAKVNVQAQLIEKKAESQRALQAQRTSDKIKLIQLRASQQKIATTSKTEAQVAALRERASAREASQEERRASRLHRRRARSRLKAIREGKREEAKSSRLSERSRAAAKTRLGQGLSSVGSAATNAAGAGVVIGAVAISQARQYGRALAEVYTLTGKDTSMDKLNSEIMEQSELFGGDLSVQAKGLYDIVSSGASTAAERTIALNAANKLAVGGVTSVAIAADGLTSAANAWGVSLEDSSRITDSFFVAMREGKLTIDQLSGSIGLIAPTASALGVTLEETNASIAAITKTGTSAEGAAAGLNAAFANILKPTADASAEARRLGIDFSASALQMQGWPAFIKKIGSNSKLTANSLSLLFGSIQGGRSVRALTNDLGEFSSQLDAQVGKTGATGEAVAKIQDTLHFRMQKSTAAMQRMGVVIGEQLAPSLISLLEELAPIVQQAAEFVKANPGFIQAFAETALQVLVLTKAMSAGQVAMNLFAGARGLGAVSTAMGTTSVASAGLAARFGAFLGPAGILAATGIAIVSLVNGYQKLEEAKENALRDATQKKTVEIDTSTTAKQGVAAIDDFEDQIIKISAQRTESARKAQDSIRSSGDKFARMTPKTKILESDVESKLRKQVAEAAEKIDQGEVVEDEQLRNLALKSRAIKASTMNAARTFHERQKQTQEQEAMFLAPENLRRQGPTTPSETQVSQALLTGKTDEIVEQLKRAADALEKQSKEQSLNVKVDVDAGKGVPTGRASR